MIDETTTRRGFLKGTFEHHPRWIELDGPIAELVPPGAQLLRLEQGTTLGYFRVRTRRRLRDGRVRFFVEPAMQGP